MRVIYQIFLKSIALSLFCLVVFSCEKENINDSIPANITSNLAPKTFAVSDTVVITINRQIENITIGQNSHVFSSLAWITPWYNSLEVKNIDSYVSQGVSMRVSVQRGSSTDWIEAYPVSNESNNNIYEYFIETRPQGAGIYNFGSLYIFYYGSDINDSPKVKVEF